MACCETTRWSRWRRGEFAGDADQAAERPLFRLADDPEYARLLQRKAGLQAQHSALHQRENELLAEMNADGDKKNALDVPPTDCLPAPNSTTLTFRGRLVVGAQYAENQKLQRVLPHAIDKQALIDAAAEQLRPPV